MLKDYADAVWNWFWNYEIHLDLTGPRFITLGQMTLINIAIAFIGTTLIMVLAICIDPAFEQYRDKIRGWIRKVYK